MIKIILNYRKIMKLFKIKINIYKKIINNKHKIINNKEKIKNKKVIMIKIYKKSWIKNQNQPQYQLVSD